MPVMLAALLLLSFLASSAIAGQPIHTFVKRNSRFANANGVYNPAFAVAEMKRNAAKYNLATTRYQANFRVFEAHEHQKRSEFASDQESLERRYRKFEAGGLAEFGVPEVGNVRRQTGTGQTAVELDSFYTSGQDTQYTSGGSSVTIGTPGQSFIINFDTGSADLWVPGPDSPTSHTKFVEARSTSFTGTTTAWSIRYGTGEVEGVLGADTVTVGGLSVERQTFAITSTTSSIFEATRMDGLMGLGFSTISEAGAPTFFENLMTNSAIQNQYFSFYLQRASDLLPETQNSGTGTIGGGQLCLGCIDASKYTGSVTYFPVTVKGYWEIAMAGIAVNNSVIASTSTAAAIDTGTSLIYVPTSVASAFYGHFNGEKIDTQGHWAIPCSTPDFVLSLAFGSSMYAINLSDFVIGYADATQELCVGSILGQDTNDPVGNPVAIVGDAFLKNVLSVYTYADNAQVGFAPSINARGGTNISASAISGSTALPTASSFSVTITAPSFGSISSRVITSAGSVSTVFSTFTPRATGAPAPSSTSGTQGRILAPFGTLAGFLVGAGVVGWGYLIYHPGHMLQREGYTSEVPPDQFGPIDPQAQG